MYAKKGNCIVEAFQMTQEHLKSEDNWPEWVKDLRSRSWTKLGSITQLDGGLYHVRVFEGSGIVDEDDWIVKNYRGHISLWPARYFTDYFLKIDSN